MDQLRLFLHPRFSVLILAGAGALLLVLLTLFAPALRYITALPALLFCGLFALGLHDMTQTRHAILRNYPIMAHLRFFFEKIRPEMRQYFFEADNDGAPFPRDKRAIVYQRAKKALDKRPFGTTHDVYQTNYEWMHHSLLPKQPAKDLFRVVIGSPQCIQPYSASIFNISAMSFGSLSANAIRALNKGARMGNFAHDTGEGGLSPYHKEAGGDVIWEIASGYFGCRNADGTFSGEKFAAVATDPQIRMIEVKLSQGAKPGHGGVLPAAKVTEEIARIRDIEMGKDCVSPASHSAFSTPLELMAFVAELRRLSGGKPTGFKLCVGHPWEFLGIFIVVDGKEGGTGAAPLEFMDHLGMPLRDGLAFVHSALIGTNLREHIRIGCSGKITTGFDMARAFALGADWCNAARGFMFAVGCIQAQQCHTGHCPTGVTTQDPLRQRAIVVPDKAQRVANFHRETVKALAELIAAAGIEHPKELSPHHFMRRAAADRVVTFAEQYHILKPGELLRGGGNTLMQEAWSLARSDSFSPAAPLTRAAE
jgi:glutamate synthase domain-containing protein 2